MYSKFVFEPKTSIKPYLKAENQRVSFPFELILTLLEKLRARDWNSVLPAIALHGYETLNKIILKYLVTTYISISLDCHLYTKNAYIV